MNWNICIIYSNMCLCVMSNITGTIVLQVGSGWTWDQVRADGKERAEWPASDEQG